MKTDIWPGVEVIFNQNSESAFYLGPITQVYDDHFYLRCYDAAGKWEKEYEISYDEIFRIELGSRYVSQFNAYMRRRNGLSAARK